MMNSFTSLSAERNFGKHKKLHSCVILICLVVAPLILALVISQSMMSSIEEKFVSLSSGHITVYSPDSIDEIEDYVENSELVINGSALAYSSSATSPLILKGVKKSYFTKERLKHITFSIPSTESQSSSNSAKIKISQSTADKLGVSYGDKIVLMAVADSKEGVLRPVMVTVEELFTTGYKQYDENFAFVDYDWASKIWTDSSSISREVILKSEFYDDVSEIQSLLKDKASSSWIELNTTVYNNFVTSKQMIMIILIIIVCVAAFYTASVAQQIVQDRKKQIAISKLLGAQDKQLIFSCLYSVLKATLVGIILGLALGLLLSFSLNPILRFISKLSIESLSYYLLAFDITIPVLSITILLLSLLLISVLTVFVSLSKIKKISPIQLFSKTWY